MRFIEDVIDRRETKHRQRARSYDKRLKQMVRHALEGIRGAQQNERRDARIAKQTFNDI